MRGMSTRRLPAKFPMIVLSEGSSRLVFAVPRSVSGGCRLPQHTNVDWIFGSSSLDFSSFVTDRSSQTRRISDHPMVRSAVTVPAAADPRCRKAWSFGWFCPRG